MGNPERLAAQLNLTFQRGFRATTINGKSSARGVLQIQAFPADFPLNGSRKERQP